MPFRSRKQLRYMAAAERRGELPKGTFQKWKEHTRDIKSLPEKVAHAYAMGVEQALLDFGVVKHAEEEKPEAEPLPNTGKETRLKRNHTPHDFFAVRRSFERASGQKKEVGTHVPVKKDS